MSTNQTERLCAEAAAKPNLPGAVKAVRSADELLHELQMHQIELEMQNETLRQTQIALEESRDRYLDLYDFAPVAYFTLSREGLILEANFTFAALLGLERQKLHKGRFAEFIASGDRQRWYSFFLDVLKNDITQRCELALQRVDGQLLFAHLDCLRIAKDNGGYQIRIVLTDITERCRAEEIAHISAQKNRLLFENSRDALMTFAPPSWKFTSANEATLKLFGASSMAEFMALTSWDVSPQRQPDGRLSSEKAQEMTEVAMRAGSHSFEWEHRRLDGQTFSSDVLLTRMDLDNKPFVQATVRDITERKRTETELREYQQLLRELAAQAVTSREAELKHIAREVHDELGQLLTALRMDISLLRIQFGERDPDLMIKIQDMLALVDKAIRGVRDVARNLRPPALDMGIGSALAWLRDEFSTRTDIPCTLRVVEEPTGLDDASTVALFRIVQESLTNIARYAEATHVEITVRQRGDGIDVEICDNGLGFDSDAVAGKRSFGLMGMKERAIAVCGKVKVSSTPMMGTVVSVHVPLCPTHPGRRIDD